MLVDLVNVKTRDGVRLDGIFRKPAERKSAELGVDVVIFHHGAFKGLPLEVEKLAKGLDRLTFESIPGADHAYTRQRDYVWGVVCRWLEKI